MSIELAIQSLRLDIQNAVGQEHRIRDITSRAVALIAEGLDSSSRGRAGEKAGAQRRSPTDVSVGPIALDLARMGDEAAARRIALETLRVLALELRL